MREDSTKRFMQRGGGMEGETMEMAMTSSTLCKWVPARARVCVSVSVCVWRLVNSRTKRRYECMLYILSTEEEEEEEEAEQQRKKKKKKAFKFNLLAGPQPTIFSTKLSIILQMPLPHFSLTSYFLSKHPSFFLSTSLAIDHHELQTIYIHLALLTTSSTTSSISWWSLPQS